MENFISEQVFASSTWSYFERAIARFLIHRGWEHVDLVGKVGDHGADVIATNMSSTAVIVAAEAAGAYSIGFQNDMSAAGPNGHLTSVIFHWEKYYIPAIQEIAAGNWTSKGLPLAGLEIGLADLTPLSSAVPADIQEKIAQVRDSIANGSFNPYTGPVRKQNGDLVVASGEVMDDGGLWGMTYFVEGIIGTMPE